MTTKDIAQVVRRAAALREASWKSAGIYTLDLQTACTTAARDIGQPEIGQLVYLALSGWWSDTIDWANEILAN